MRNAVIQQTFTTSLTDVYPNIQDQLCNKHTVNILNIKKKFNYLYSGCMPELYIVSKGLVFFSSNFEKCSESSQLSMALESGVVVAVSRTNLQDKIYVNYNKWEDSLEGEQFQQQSEKETELILNYKGEIQSQPDVSKSCQQQANNFSKVYKLAIEDLSLSKIRGAIIYIDNKLKKGCFHEEQALIFGFIVAILAINDLLNEYSTKEIIEKMKDYYKAQKKDQQRLERYQQIHKYKHNQLYLKNKVDMKNKNKIIFSLLPTQEQPCISQNNAFSQLLKYQESQIAELSANRVSFEQLLENIRNYSLTILPTEPNNKLLSFLSKYISLSNGIIFPDQPSFIALSFPNRVLPEIIARIGNQIKDCEGKQKKDPRDILQSFNNKNGAKRGKWRKYQGIQQLVFSCFPATGFNILNPNEQIWYME